MIKKIPSFSDYLISDKGIVYSIAERANRGRPKEPVIKAYFMCWGYKAIHLVRNGKSYKRYIHRLLLETFVGPCPKNKQCRHLDGNKLNLNLSNLKWGTRRENQHDRMKHGTANYGETHGMTKLTNTDVLQIRKLGKEANKHTRKIDNGGNYREIAKKFSIAPSTVGAIVQGRAWKYL